MKERKKRKVWKTLGIILLVIIAMLVLGFLAFKGYFAVKVQQAQAQLGSEAPELTVDGLTFRDLNKNGELDPYEDHRLTPEERADDLIVQMTLEEKAGMMFLAMVTMGENGEVVEQQAMMQAAPMSEYIAGRSLNHFTLMGAADARGMAEWNNALQLMAEQTRLGIPVSLNTDPRNEVPGNVTPFSFVGDFTLGPTPMGFAATFDPELLGEFCDIMRQEYTAVGLRVAQHPQADLATEPRWARMSFTYGEDAELASQMLTACITGFQGEELGPESVAVMVKHFPGAGPQEDGGDAHFEDAKDQAYPGENFDYHLIPFEAAFEANTAMVMPYYATPGVLPYETVGFAFNKEIITGLLREEMGFDGVVTTDFGILQGLKMFGVKIMDAPAWGVENLDMEERMIRALEAGVDQIGGADFPDLLVAAVESGKISEERLDESVRRLLLIKFQLGLFDDPYVDPDQAVQIVGQDAFQAVGDLAQRRSIILLENNETAGDITLPLNNGSKIYVEGIDPEVAAMYGSVVDKPEEADFAIIRLAAPAESGKEAFSPG